MSLQEALRNDGAHPAWNLARWDAFLDISDDAWQGMPGPCRTAFVIAGSREDAAFDYDLVGDRDDQVGLLAGPQVRNWRQRKSGGGIPMGLAARRELRAASAATLAFLITRRPSELEIGLAQGSIAACLGILDGLACYGLALRLMDPQPTRLEVVFRNPPLSSPVWDRALESWDHSEALTGLTYHSKRTGMPQTGGLVVAGNAVAALPPFTHSELALADRRNVDAPDSIDLPWRPEALTFMARRFFGIRSLRTGQLAIVNRLREGRHVLAIYPTGYGKSLSYHLLSLVVPGVVLVVLPTETLLHDQVRMMERSGFGAFEIARGGTWQAQRGLVLVTGDVVASHSAQISRTLGQAPPSAVVVDEAHCASAHGHEQIPAYRLLADLLRRLDKPVPLGLLTATAQPRVVDELCSMFGLPADSVVRYNSSDRPNIGLSIATLASERREGRLQALAQEIEKSLPRGPAAQLVFFDAILAANRQYLDLHALGRDIAGQVRTQHLVFEVYTQRGLPPIRKPPAVSSLVGDAETLADPQMAPMFMVQDWFRQGKVDVLVASRDYGMGMDNLRIHRVLHGDLPASLENYYQQVGRAGRDGGPATATLVVMPPTPKCSLDLAASGGKPRCLPAGEFKNCPFGLKGPCDYALQGAKLATQSATGNRFRPLADLNEVLVQAQAGTCLRWLLRAFFDPGTSVPPKGYRCEYCSVCSPRGWTRMTAAVSEADPSRWSYHVDWEGVVLTDNHTVTYQLAKTMDTSSMDQVRLRAARLAELNPDCLGPLLFGAVALENSGETRHRNWSAGTAATAVRHNGFGQLDASVAVVLVSIGMRANQGDVLADAVELRPQLLEDESLARLAAAAGDGAVQPTPSTRQIILLHGMRKLRKTIHRTSRGIEHETN